MKLIYSLLIIIGSLINGMFAMPISHDQASFYILDKPSGSVFIKPQLPQPIMFEPLEINIQ